MSNIYVYSFYRFKLICEKQKIKSKIDIYKDIYNLKGTILIAREGINGSISGKRHDLNKFIIDIKKLLKIRKLSLKINKANFVPFNRFKVKLKNEIVSLGKKNIHTQKNSGKLINPKDWDNIIENSDYSLIDTRNKFEIEIGSFKNAINPQTTSFREFPKKFNNLNIKKDSKIAMFCTGGIRCEKASSYLKGKGYKYVYQLEGGILNYLKYKKNKQQKIKWKGDCFVFDNRVTVNRNLDQGKYIQCYGCRRPITRKDTLSKKYIKGVACPYCFKERSNEQKRNSMVRQIQIENAEKNNLNHPFSKITKL